MESTKRQISEYLKKHRKMTLATVNPEGTPVSHTVEYVSEGNIVYFATRKDTRKVKNIIDNHHVAYTVDEDYDDWMKIQGVQMEGIAVIVEDRQQLNVIMQKYVEKFPFVAAFPPNPDLVFIKVSPQTGYFLDYEKGFTHRDRVSF